MRNLTPSEFFSKGKNAMDQKNFLIAERCFLTALFEYSKKQEDYAGFIDSLDELSLYLYPEGNFENKDRALEFFKLFSRVDKNVSQGYAWSLANGVFGEPDYSEAIKQISKAYYDEQAFFIAYLLHKGKGLEKDISQSALFLKYLTFRLSSRRLREAKELYDSIGVEIRLSEREIEEKVDARLKEIFKDKFLEKETHPFNKDFMVIEFFKNTKNIPNIV